MTARWEANWLNKHGNEPRTKERKNEKGGEKKNSAERQEVQTDVGDKCSTTLHGRSNTGPSATYLLFFSLLFSPLLFLFLCVCFLEQQPHNPMMSATLFLGLCWLCWLFWARVGRVPNYDTTQKDAWLRFGGSFETAREKEGRQEQLGLACLPMIMMHG